MPKKCQRMAVAPVAPVTIEQNLIKLREKQLIAVCSILVSCATIIVLGITLSSSTDNIAKVVVFSLFIVTGILLGVRGICLLMQNT